MQQSLNDNFKNGKEVVAWLQDLSFQGMGVNELNVNHKSMEVKK